MAMAFSTRRWQDQLILLLGIWLFVSPWAFGIPSQWPLAINAYVVGAAMALLAAFDLYRTYFWAVLTNLILAVWIAVSPWVPAFIGDREMAANSVTVGIAVLVLGLWELRSDPELRRQWADSGVMH